MHRTAPRRRRLRIVAALAGAAMVGGLLAACAPPSDGGDKGGDKSDTLVFGITGSNKDQVNPYSSQNSPPSEALYHQLYEGLTTLDNDGSVKMALAESMEPNETLDVWTVHLREGVKRHDGKEFTADDVISSVKYILDPANAFAPSTQVNMVDPNGLRKIDDHTVEMKLTRPYGPFPAAWSSNRLAMVGGDPKAEEPAGTGPFELVSFAAGQEAKLKRFDDYWGEKPGFTNLRMVYFQDQPALTNALRGGQVDVVFSVPFTDVASLKNAKGVKILESDSSSHLVIEMRTDLKPFSDVRVRTALKLAVDREQMVKNAFGGFAEVANDINGNNTACPPPDVPQRKQDLEQAKKLLAEAGYPDGFSMELPTDNGYPGMLETAQLFAQQVAPIGVKVDVKKLDIASFLNKWLEWPSLIGFTGSPYLVVATAHFLPEGEENATHFNDAEYIELAKKLYATADEDEQCALIAEMQRIEYERGGDIVPVYSKEITAYNERVHGLKSDLNGRTSYRYAGVTLD